MLGPEPDPPTLSVVVPVRNGVPLLRRLLSALAAEQLQGHFEVVVADNASTDGTRLLAESFAQLLDVRVVEVTTRGVSAARNCGVIAARSEIVVLLDHDDVIKPGYLQAMADALQEHDLVASRIEVETDRPWSRAREVPQTAGLGNSGWLPWAYGATLGFRRERYLAVGGCDEELVGGGDDIDFCWRAQMNGADLHWVPSAVLRYRIPDRPWSLFKQGYSYGRGGRRVHDRFRSYGVACPSIIKQLEVTVRLIVSALVGRTPVVRLPFLFGRRLGYLWASIRTEAIAPVRQDGTLADSPKQP